MFRIGIVVLLFLSNGICDDNSVVPICSASAAVAAIAAIASAAVAAAAIAAPAAIASAAVAAAAIAAPATPATNRRTEHLLYRHLRDLHRRAELPELHSIAQLSVELRQQPGVRHHADRARHRKAPDSNLL
jgi:hypothetical protein